MGPDADEDPPPELDDDEDTASWKPLVTSMADVPTPLDAFPPCGLCTFTGGATRLVGGRSTLGGRGRPPSGGSGRFTTSNAGGVTAYRSVSA